MTDFLRHRAAPGESWGWIALRYYADERQMERLMVANPRLRNVAIFEGGEEVLVPVIAEADLAEDDASIPPWRR